MKKIKGLKKRWYIFRELLGIPSKKYNSRNCYGNYTSYLASNLFSPKNCTYRNNDTLDFLFKKYKTHFVSMCDEKLKYLCDLNAMFGVTEQSIGKLIEYSRGKNKKLLSVGCGMREQLSVLKDSGFDVYGVDIDVPKNKQTDNLKWHDLNKMGDLPFNEEEFDFVLCQEVIEHIENPWMLFRKIKRVLKKNGIFVLTTPNISSVACKTKFIENNHGYNWFFNEDNMWQHINPLAFWEIMHIASYNDFDLLELTGNQEYYFDFTDKKTNKKNMDLTIENNDILHFIFKNKNNVIKDYIPVPTMGKH